MDFANSRSADPRLSVVRATIGTIINAAGRLEVVPANAPRIDYEPLTGRCIGLLMEERRTNVAVQSGFGNGLAGSVVSPTGVTAVSFPGFPGGALVEKTAEGSYVYKPYSDAPLGTEMALSLFIRMLDGAPPVVSSSNAVGDLGVVVEGEGATSTTVTDMGFGLYRVKAKRIVNGSGGNWGVVKYAGQSSRAFLVTGYQLEAGQFSTSYIPTSTAQVTRAEDVALMSGANFSSWYRQDEGTIYQEFVPIGVSATDRVSIALRSELGGLFANSHTFRNFNGAQELSTRVNSVAQTELAARPDVYAGQINKIAYAYKSNDFAASKSGGGVEIDAAGQVPSNVAVLEFPGAGCNHIRRFAYYPARLTNAQIQRITA